VFRMRAARTDQTEEAQPVQHLREQAAPPGAMPRLRPYAPGRRSRCPWTTVPGVLA
jgi:hypothetical protein